MTSQTAALMASQINNTLTEEDFNENKKYATAYTKTRKIISRSITSYYADSESSFAISESSKKASDLGYTGFSVEVCFANWYNLDWKIIPWVKPLTAPGDWVSTEEWETFCVEQGLNPTEHIQRAEKEYHCDKVSLMLWNRRVSAA
jgi:hypothetical protein